jgi:hypothetical protein
MDVTGLIQALENSLVVIYSISFQDSNHLQTTPAVLRLHKKTRGLALHRTKDEQSTQRLQAQQEKWRDIRIQPSNHAALWRAIGTFYPFLQPVTRLIPIPAHVTVDISPFTSENGGLMEVL